MKGAPAPPSLQPDPEQASRAMRDAVRRLMVAHAALDDARRPCGAPLPMPHAWALLELHARGPMTVTALAAGLDIDRTNVSRLCARMEALGELERAEHPDDGRARLLRLTDEGTRLAQSVDTSSAAHFAAVLGRLEADARALVEGLDALARAMAPRATTDPDQHP